MNKGKDGITGLKALAAHSAIHAAGTMLICLVFAPSFWFLSLVDFCLHGLIDKTKSKTLVYFNLNAKDSKFWWIFGFDQELHNLSHLTYIIIIVSYASP